MQERTESAVETFLEVSLIMTLFIFLSVSLAHLFHYVRTGLMLNSIVMAFTAWISYVSIHHIETGKLIDTRKDEKSLPDSDAAWVIFGLSSFLFMTGMAWGATGVNSSDMIQASLGAGVLLTGYFIAHYELSGEEIV